MAWLTNFILSVPGVLGQINMDYLTDGQGFRLENAIEADFRVVSAEGVGQGSRHYILIGYRNDNFLDSPTHNHIGTILSLPENLPSDVTKIDVTNPSLLAQLDIGKLDVYSDATGTAVMHFMPSDTTPQLVVGMPSGGKQFPKPPDATSTVISLLPSQAMCNSGTLAIVPWASLPKDGELYLRPNTQDNNIYVEGEYWGHEVGCCVDTTFEGIMLGEPQKNDKIGAVYQFSWDNTISPGIYSFSQFTAFAHTTYNGIESSHPTVIGNGDLGYPLGYFDKSNKSQGFFICGDFLSGGYGACYINSNGEGDSKNIDPNIPATADNEVWITAGDLTSFDGQKLYLGRMPVSVIGQENERGLVVSGPTGDTIHIKSVFEFVQLETASAPDLIGLNLVEHDFYPAGIGDIQTTGYQLPPIAFTFTDINGDGSPDMLFEKRTIDKVTPRVFELHSAKDGEINEASSLRGTANSLNRAGYSFGAFLALTDFGGINTFCAVSPTQIDCIYGAQPTTEYPSGLSTVSNTRSETTASIPQGSSIVVDTTDFPKTVSETQKTVGETQSLPVTTTGLFSSKPVQNPSLPATQQQQSTAMTVTESARTIAEWETGKIIRREDLPLNWKEIGAQGTVTQIKIHVLDGVSLGIGNIEVGEFTLDQLDAGLVQVLKANNFIVLMVTSTENNQLIVQPIQYNTAGKGENTLKPGNTTASNSDFTWWQIGLAIGSAISLLFSAFFCIRKFKQQNRLDELLDNADRTPQRTLRELRDTMGGGSIGEELQLAVRSGHQKPKGSINGLEHTLVDKGAFFSSSPKYAPNTPHTPPVQPTPPCVPATHGP